MARMARGAELVGMVVVAGTGVVDLGGSPDAVRAGELAAVDVALEDAEA